MQQNHSAHQNQTQDKYGLLTAPTSQVLRQMTLPMVMGIVTILMFNFVDTFFISLLGTQSLAAISFTFSVTFAVNCITMGIGTAISTFTGRLLGQGDTGQAARLSTHGILLATLLVAIVSCIGLLSIEPLFQLIGAEPELIPLIKSYLFIWFMTVPLLVVPMSGNAAIRAYGDTKTPAKIMVGAGLINGCLDPLLIFGIGPFPELGIEGAAIASAISWLFAMFYSLFVLATRVKLLIKPKLNLLLADWQAILRIGLPASLTQALNPLCAVILMVMITQYGTEAVAAFGAAQRIEPLLLIVLMALTSALTPFMAQNLGANNQQRCFDALLLCIRFSIAFQLLIFIALVPLSTSIAGLFSKTDNVRYLIWLYLVSVPGSYGFQGIIMVLVGSLNAMQKPVTAFIWSCLRLFVFTIPCAWIGSQHYGITGLFAGVAIGNVCGGICGYLYAIRLRQQLPKQPSLTLS